MDRLLSIKLTVAKLCHEMANHISVMKFIQEDLENAGIHGSKDLLESIDLLVQTMDFFRSMYATSEKSSNIRNILLALLKLKNINLLDKDEIFNSLSFECESVVCGIIYVLMKLCKSGNAISVSGGTDRIKIGFEDEKTIPESICETLNNDFLEENVFNIFISYIKELAISSGIEIIADFDNGYVQVWKR
ncbi:MAG: hypothetical protein LBI95_01975 [Holosporales bacterium]|jgi:hypothetical protein|nr:hypothetical protein [Holosporales bacterium]